MMTASISNRSGNLLTGLLSGIFLGSWLFVIGGP
jgi:hypothetical protein